ncbi:MAG: hypothetical protein IJP22_02425 [Clostridia bacterium]|nr:hypothetical protein [Clostridia bacterium]
MKALKRLFVILLAVAMIVTVVGCHPKDEVAVTIGDFEFTSAYYMCALMAADSEAKSKVDEAKANETEETEEEHNHEEGEEEVEETTEETDYYAEKIDDKDYVTWVEDTAIENLKKIAAYKTLCKENKLELDEETESSVDSYTDYYWSSYGYSMYYEPNGVGKTTYANYMRDSYYSSLYFDHLYAEDGEKEIAAKDVKAKINDNFIIANMLTASFSEMEEDDVKATQKQFKAYEKELKEGKRSFLEIYNEYNKVEETEEETTAQETEESKPKDENATILGAEGTTYESEYYDTVKKMKKGAIKLIEEEDGIVLVVKQDIKADKYYYETLDSEARHLIADDEFEADILEYAKTLKADINKYATGQFKVKKIKEPEYN